MNSCESLIIFIPGIESLTAKFPSITEYDEVINADVTHLVSKDVFIIEERLCKSV